MPPAYPPKAAPLRGMSLRAKSLLLMGGALLVVMGIYVAGLSISLLGSFGDLQDDLTIQRVDRVVTQLEKAATLQQLLVSRRATSDATYALLTSENAPLEKAGLAEPSPVGPDIIWLFDRHKNAAGSLILNDSLRQLEASGRLPAIEAFRHSRLLGDDETVSTIQRIPDGLLLLSSATVLRSNGSGPTPGWVVFGTVLDSKWFETLTQATGVSARPPGQTIDPAKEGLTRDLARAPGVLDRHRVLTHPRSGGTREGVMLEFQRGLTPDPVQLQLTIPSLVFAAAIRMRTELIWTSVVCVGLLMLCSVLIVEFLFIRRIAKMDQNLQQLAEIGDAAVRLDAGGSDEFSRLAVSANRLLEALRRRRGEAEKQETLLSGVLDSASEAIMAFRAHRNEDGLIDDFIMVLANRAAQLIILHPVEEMIGHRLLDIFPGNREAGLFERYVKVVEQRVQDSHEFYYEHDGLQMWFESYISPWEDGFVVTFAEITQRKETEQELQHKLEEIERFNRAMIGREERVLEMKAEVNELRARFGLPAAYRVDSRSDDV